MKLTSKLRREIAARLQAPNKLDGAIHYDGDVTVLLAEIDRLLNENSNLRSYVARSAADVAVREAVKARAK